MSPRKERSAVPLTEARVRLFQLVEDLLAGRTDRIALSHRAREEQVLLVRASDIERMEAELAALRRRSAVSEPRPLWGIATLVGDPETIIDEIRAEERRQSEKRMREFCADPPPEVSAEPQPETPRPRVRGRGSRARKPAP
jgi:hypothetical protein